jgi:hypothetical protein
LTCGLFCGIGLFAITWWIILWDGPSAKVTVIGLVYRGYSLTPVGSLAGLIWGLVDGAIGGAIFAWAHNLLARRFTTGPAA